MTFRLDRPLLDEIYLHARACFPEEACGIIGERGGAWEICNSVRSTSGCPSLNQGIDAPSGQGHLCYEPHAKRFAKAFLYAIYLAGK